MKNFFFLLGSLLVSGFAVAQCEADHTVEASSFQYAPEVLNIEVGETVAFVNLGGQHDVNGIASSIDGMSFNNPEEFYLSPVMGSAEGVCIGTHTFTMPGTYQYDCSIGTHAQLGMVASIVVSEPATGTVVDVVVNSPDHTLLEAAVLAAGLDGALSAEGPFTVFAPTDAAIGALVTALEITAEDLLALPELGDILQYHVVAGSAMSTSLTDGQAISTLLGPDVTVTINEDGVFINDAMVTVADIVADNGVVHVIDAVLLPPPPPPSNTVVDIIVNSPDHTLLEAAVLAAGLDGALSAEGPFTVFAPTDAAINTLLDALMLTAEDLLASPMLVGILSYHVAEGLVMSGDLTDGQTITTLLMEDVTVTINTEGVFINNAMVTMADIEADNGVVHVIDAVLIPPMPEPTTVVDIIVESEVHTLLEAAVGAAGLVDYLSAPGPFTVFAPTDDAIIALTTALDITAEELLASPDLSDILKYHVVEGLAMSTDLSDGQTIATLLGPDVTVTINAEGVFINDAMVTVADIEADNGVVHVIDAVLLPPTPETNTVVDIIVNSEDHTLLELAVGAAGLVETLSGEGPFTVFAPTDAAIVALTEALNVTAEELLALPELADILKYHVVAGTALSTDLSDGQSITTLLGTDVTVTIDANGVFINDAQVVVADILADNGVVHVIDAVLLPTTSNVVEAQLNVTVFPNPASEWVRVEGASSTATMVLRDAQGRLVTAREAANNTVSLEGIPAGMYYLEIQDGVQQNVTPVIVR